MYTKSYVKQTSTQEKLLVYGSGGGGGRSVGGRIVSVDLMDTFTLVLCELVSLNMMVGS